MIARQWLTGPGWTALSTALCGGAVGGGWTGLARVLPPHVFGVMSAVLLVVGCVWFGRLGAFLGREQRRRNDLLKELLDSLSNRDSAYEYQLVWGSRRAAGPLEFRRHRNTGVVEWRYDDSTWMPGEVPGQISSLFELKEAKKT